jgi:hypothetical protein
VLLVSHDIYAAARLCERMVWLDRGRVLFDGRTQEAMRAYENSVREQEESRLRARKLLGGGAPASSSSALVEVVARAPMREAVPIARISIITAAGAEVELPVTGAGAFDGGGNAHLVRENGNWADEVAEVDGRAARAMKAFGSPYHKVAGYARLPDASGIARVTCTYRSPAGTLLRLACFDGAGREVFAGELASTDGQWREAVIDGACAAPPAASAERPLGTNRIAITDARFVDATGREIFILEHGGPVRLLVDYRVNDPALAEKAQVVVALHRDGATDTCRFIARDLAFDGVRAQAGTIEFRLARMPVTEGRYSLTVLIAEEGYYDRPQTRYFSVNPGVYACASRMLEFDIAGSSGLSSGTVFVGEADWTLLPAPRSPEGEKP